jgi:hypothetical protein
MHQPTRVLGHLLLMTTCQWHQWDRDSLCLFYLASRPIVPSITIADYPMTTRLACVSVIFLVPVQRIHAVAIPECMRDGKADGIQPNHKERWEVWESKSRFSCE